MRHHQARRVEDSGQIAIERGGEQGLAQFAFLVLVGVRAVHHDEVVLVLRFLDVREGVANGEVKSGVIPGVPGQGGPVRLGDVDHAFVNLHHIDLLQADVGHQLADGAAVAAANHQGAPGGGQVGQGHIDEPRVVEAFIEFRQLDMAIQKQHLPKGVAAH